MNLMSSDLPDFYFRIRDNGASVFKVDTENRQRRIELEEIAMVNMKNRAIKPHGDRKLDAGEVEAIRNWMAGRAELIAVREIDDILRAVDHLNLTTHWAQSRASDEALEEVTDSLLLAMHDLRTVLVRRKAERLMGNAAE